MRKEDYYNRQKGCEGTLIKIGLIFAFIIATTFMAISQPVKTTFGFTSQGYNPVQPTIVNKPVRGPRGPQGIQGVAGISTKDTVFLEPVLEDYPTISMTYQIVDDELQGIATKTDSIWSIMHVMNAQNIYKLNDIQDNFEIHKLRQNGVTKIISGLGLQVAALGVLALSEIDKISSYTITTNYDVPYTYTEYQISNTEVTTQTIVPVNKCKPHHGNGNNTTIINTTVNTPTITPIVKTGTVKFTTTDRAPCIQERNKNAYYVAASIMGAVGVALEVSGFIDLHKANVYVTQNSVGLKIRF